MGGVEDLERERERERERAASGKTVRRMEEHPEWLTRPARKQVSHPFIPIAHTQEKVQVVHLACEAQPSAWPRCHVEQTASPGFHAGTC